MPLQSTACTAARHPVSSSHEEQLQLLKLGMQLRPLPGWRMDQVTQLRLGQLRATTALQTPFSS